MPDSNLEAGAVRASVVIAAYNGEPFLQAQLDSVLLQLSDADELVVVDDGSTDGTGDVLARYANANVNVRIVTHFENAGHVAAFETGIKAARGACIVLCDQDDLWVPGRLDLLVSGCHHAPVVASSFETFGVGSREGEAFGFSRTRQVRGSLPMVQLFLGREPYFGSAMAFRRTLTDVLLPFPRIVEAHDLWLAQVGLMSGGILQLPDVTLHRRLHGNNLTPRSRRGLGPVVITRLRLLGCLYYAGWRRRRATSSVSRTGDLS